MYDMGSPPFLSQHRQRSARAKSHAEERLAQGPSTYIQQSIKNVTWSCKEEIFRLQKKCAQRKTQLLALAKSASVHNRNGKSSWLQEAVKGTSFHSVNTVKATELQYASARYTSLSLCVF